MKTKRMKKAEVEVWVLPSIFGDQQKGCILPFVKQSEALKEVDQKDDEKEKSDIHWVILRSRIILPDIQNAWKLK